MSAASSALKAPGTRTVDLKMRHRRIPVCQVFSCVLSNFPANILTMGPPSYIPWPAGSTTRSDQGSVVAARPWCDMNELRGLDHHDAVPLALAHNAGISGP